jgi:predicted methyltransferase
MSTAIFRPHSALGLFVLLAACGSSLPPEAPPGAPIDPPRTKDDLLESMMGGDASSGPAAAEDPKARAEREALEKDFAALDAKIAKEKARIEPLRKDLAALEAKDFNNFKDALAAALKSPHRAPGNAERDKFRHPAETLGFFNLRPDMAVLELDAGAGWYTELLAPVLFKKGKLTVSGPDPSGPSTERATLYGKTLRAMLDAAPEIGSKVEYVNRAGDGSFTIGKENAYDAILALRTLHNWQRKGSMDKNLAECFKALKPGGVLGVEAHRAKDGADPKVTAEKGYLPEKFVIERAQAAGFKLDGKSEVNANPKDTADHPEGVWSLAPTFRKVPDADKPKLEAIGESDRMTLRFVKPKK